MRGVGDELVLRSQEPIELPSRVVERCRDGADLGRSRTGRRARRWIAVADARGREAEGLERTSDGARKGDADGEPYEQHEQRDRAEDRPVAMDARIHRRCRIGDADGPDAPPSAATGTAT